MVDDTFASMKRAKMVRKKRPGRVGHHRPVRSRPLPKGAMVLHQALPSSHEKMMLKVKRVLDDADERLARRMREIKKMED